MRDESDVWQALLRRKGLSVTNLASQLGVTRQHAHRLVTGRRPADTQRAELEAALALGFPSNGAPPLRDAWGAGPEPRKLFVVDELPTNFPSSHS